MSSGADDETGRVASPSARAATLAAVIVCYQPTQEKVERICTHLVADRCIVVVVDNTEQGHDGMAKLPEPCVLIALGRNLGIAHAQNVGVAEATLRGATMIAFLDQDSTIEPGFLRALASHLEPGRPGIVAPACVDDVTGEQLPSERLVPRGRSEGIVAGPLIEPYAVDVVISSGTVATKEVFDIVGGLDESMFIDFVDTEWCLRCRSRGIPIYVVPTVVMRHRIGTKSIRLAGRTLLIHSPARCYYQLRNGFHLLRKRHVPKLYALRRIASILASRLALLHHAGNRREYARAMLAGVRDGILGVGGSWQERGRGTGGVGREPGHVTEDALSGMNDKLSGNEVSGTRIARNTLWNIAGQVVPLAAAVLSIPILVNKLGVERFGALTLVWMVMGYYSLFDLGLSRSLIKVLSAKIGSGDQEDIPAIIGTALALIVMLGIIGGGLVLGLTDWFIVRILNIPAELRSEVSDAFRWLALSVPVVILTTGLRGIPEAYQRFDLVNLVRIPLGILMFIAPLVALPFTKRLDVIIIILLGLRLLLAAFQVGICEQVVPGIVRRMSVSSGHIVPLLKFGGWVTVTNIVGPLMIYMDRFVISSVFTLADVAYYVTPYEVVTKLLILPGALVGVLFPAFSASIAFDRGKAAALFLGGVRWTFLALYPTVLLVVVFAHDGLRLWLSQDFADHGAGLLQLLAAGVLLNSIAHIPFAFVQGAGKANLTAMLHLIELPLYFLALWACMHAWGIDGAAAAWTFRAGIDAVALLCISVWLDNGLRQALTRVALTLVASLAVLAFGALLHDLTMQVAFVILSVGAFVVAAWLYLLTSEEKKMLCRFFGSHHRAGV